MNNLLGYNVLMEFHLLMAVLAAVLTIVSVVPYVRDMLRGSTRPNVVSWGLWAVIQSIFAAGQFASGASLSIVLPLIEVVSVGIIVVLGLVGYGYKKYGRVEVACLALSLLAIVLWQTTGDPMVALWFAVFADFAAAVPTLVKAYTHPKSETPLAYLLVVLSAVAAGFASDKLDLPNLLWPAYIFAVNGAILGLILVGKKRTKGRK